MNALQVEHYVKRAMDFYQGLEILRNDGDYRASSALLAIHSAISYSDALRAGLGDDRLYADDHRQAILSLRGLLAERRLADKKGYTHFEYLLSMKSFVAYGGRWLDDARSMRIALSAERFATWATRVTGTLKMEGWIDERD